KGGESGKRSQSGKSSDTPAVTPHVSGKLAESYAAKVLTEAGYTRVLTDVKDKHGQLDIVAFEEKSQTLAVVEVRSVKPRAGILTSDILPPAKQRQVVKTACRLLKYKKLWRPGQANLRFDAFFVWLDK